MHEMCVQKHKHARTHTYSLYSKLTLEVMLSIAFGIALDIQNGKGGEIYNAVRDLFSTTEGDVDFVMLQFVLGKTAGPILL